MTDCTVQWYMAALNSFIHVVMYGYYAGTQTRWAAYFKPIAKYITTMQVLRIPDLQMVQFVVGNFGLGLMWYYYHFSGFKCSGEAKWGFLSTGLTFAYFIMFAQMYLNRYQANTKKSE